VARCHQEFTAGLDDYANLLASEGRYADAQTFYARSLTIRRKCLGPNHSLTATIIHNQAELARQMGDLVTAERLHQQATAIWARGLGPNHPYVARGLDALAEVAQAAGSLPKARALYERALAIRLKTGGPYHPDVAWTLTNLAGVLLSSGDRAAALLRVNEAIDIYQRGGAAQEPDHFARLVMLRGTIELRSSDYAAAGASYDRALTLRAEIFGTDHPLWAEAEIGRATANFALGSAHAAMVSALDAERIGRDHLRFTDRYLPERQAMAYAAARPRGLDLALSIAAVDGSLEPARVLDAIIRSRGVILDELAARAQSASTNADPQLALLNRSLTAARQRFATLMLRSLEGEEVVPTRLLDEARQQKEDAERTLAERSGTAREEAARAQAGLDDVRRSLAAGSALVSFVRYDRTSIITRAGRRAVTTTPSYIALVARADRADVQIVPLGTASSIERLIDAWRSQAGGGPIAAGIAPREAERTYRVTATSLRLRIWDPIAGAIAGATRVFIVPDGALNLVSFAALPVGNRYLLEAGPAIHYLSTERDLVRSDPMAGHGLLALGGPAFDVRVSNGPAAVRRSGGCPTIGALRFEDLPGSRAEIQDIAKIWGNQDDVLILSGRAATKTALTNSIVGRKVVHLATHGFFLGSGCEPTMPRTRGVGGVVSATPVPTDNPLLLAGLALAGVNTLSRTSQANGILNAEEIAGLNLQGTEWAVLSACDTGLGQITAGEGVFGLRRALQIAGVRTIIMSLWSVEDRSTRDWMKALYEARLTKQLDTPQSVRAASIQVLEDRRKRGLTTHPFYWAAFVAAGDWR
jgi:CHAT domain-containing protein